MEHGEEHGGEFTLAPRPDADLLHAARQGGAGALDAVAHLGLGEVHVQIGTELQEEANLVLRGVGIDVLDARQRAELLFQHARHFFFILLRAGAGVCQKYLQARIADAIGHQLQRDGPIRRHAHNQDRGKQHQQQDRSCDKLRMKAMGCHARSSRR